MRGRWLFTSVVVLLCIAVPVGWIANDPHVAETAFEAFSTYNTSSGGLSQAFAYLAERRSSDHVQRLTRPESVHLLATDAVVFRVVISGSEPPPAVESKPAKDGGTRRSVLPLLEEQEEQWLRSGGRLVLAFSGSWRGMKARSADCSHIRRVFPGAPAAQFDAQHCRSIEGGAMQRFHALIVAGHDPLILRATSGRGEIIVLAIPEIFSNEYLGQAQHLELLEWLVRGRRSIYFDEVAHGIVRESSLNDILLRDWTLGPAIFAFAVAALLQFWRRARRLGPADRPRTDERSEAIDLVESAGRLYDKSVDREEALRLYYRGLIRAAHVRTGLAGEPLEHYVSARTEGYDPARRARDLSREEFNRMLKILNRAYETVGHAHAR